MELAPQEKSYYKELFIAADKDKDGVIGRADAAFLRKAKLQDSVLGQVRLLANRRM
jgi:hypothetical protein